MFCRMERLIGALALCCTMFFCWVRPGAAGTFPRLLPPATDFRLTLREDPNSALPLGASCMGEAALTLACRAFILTLENASTHTIHLSGVACAEPSIVFEVKLPQSTSGWWPVSQPGKPACTTPTWTNLRLAPGDRTQYATRLIAPRRTFPVRFLPGSYTLRAKWTLYGCTEESDGTDCLAPLQVTSEGSSVARVAMQEPVIATSNEIMAESPTLPELGTPKFSFEVTVRPLGTTVPGRTTGGCDAKMSASIPCRVFHYVVRNLSDRAVLNAVCVCSGLGIVPEYRTASEEWKPVPPVDWVCSGNPCSEIRILPGASVEGDFRLATLAPGYDMTALRAAGQYRLRFTFLPSSCLASPDGSFCLTQPEKQAPVLSREVTVRAQ